MIRFARAVEAVKGVGRCGDGVHEEGEALLETMRWCVRRGVQSCCMVEKRRSAVDIRPGRLCLRGCR